MASVNTGKIQLFLLLIEEEFLRGWMYMIKHGFKGVIDKGIADIPISSVGDIIHRRWTSIET
jgi:hypothetical protein